MSTGFASSGTSAIFEVLRDWGVRYVFTCPGTTEVPFLDASFAYPEISIITTTHESVAVAMADGYARVTGKPVVAYLHTNVGLTNGLAHLSAVRIAHSPVLILNGLKTTRIQNRGGFTTAPAMRDFVRQYTKWDWLTLRADAIGEDVNRALKVATAAPQGPVYLGIAQDMLAASTPVPIPPAHRYQIAARSRPDPDQIATATQLLTQATRPLIVAGDEITRSHASNELSALAELLQAPVMVEDRTSLESCAFPPSHPHYIGPYLSTHKAVQDADVIMLAGARTFIEFDWKETPALPPATSLIHLYSDASEIAKIYPTDVALVGDAKLGLGDLLSTLSQQQLHNRTQRQAHLRTARSAYEVSISQAHEDAANLDNTVPIRVPALMQHLARLLTPRSIVVGDPVTSLSALLTHLLPHLEHGFYTTASGSLGWGMAAALGIKLAMPDEEVIALVGDGVFQFGIQALWTAVHYHLPIIFVVINNQSYAAVKAGLYRYKGVAAQRQEFPACDISGPQLAEIARGFGAFGQRVERLADLAPALQTARDQTIPAVIDVMTDTHDVGPLQR
jgi:benzoylformate decarboxylase